MPSQAPFEVGALQWVALEISYLLCFLVNGFILITEWTRRTRLSEQAILPTTMSKWCPLLSLVSATFYGLFGCLHFVSFVCSMTANPFLITAGFQGIFVGFYQLDRLYHCFAQKEEYSAHAYPFPVFVFMVFYGLVLALWTLIFPWTLMTTKCELDEALTFTSTTTVRWQLAILVALSLLLYVVWDFTTLLLYAVKLGSARNHVRNNVHEFQPVYYRVVSMLQRILVLTIMYDVMTVIWMASTVIEGVFSERVSSLQYFLAIASSIAMSLSVFLMQPHNEKEYKKFLKVFGKSKVHYVCCFCCRSLIQREIADNADDRERLMGTSEDNTMDDAYMQMPQ